MFETCSTPQEVKNEYRRLAFANHPDKHNAQDFDMWNSKMQDINEAYMRALDAMNGFTFTGDDSREHKYTYNQDQEQALIEAVARAIRAKLPGHVTVTIVGIYIWIEGLTRDDKEYHAALKSANKEDGTGFIYHSKRQCWYWKPGGYRTHYNRSATLETIKGYYGATVVDPERQTALIS